ncbi:hypothetical protein KC222_21190 [Cedecea davisae]|uniref:DUF805 domain-containing protein n=1 Tax=Cedecea davisae TaxID=158484 RepID=A0ABS6DMQ9_9ENTR|nr:hypothetical protein [Cedecea davisae]MBU4684514.1 hypothetical protein [Cedecea davisae]MBU4688640.1 hypothetical protein [Cedecea davisae]
MSFKRRYPVTDYHLSFKEYFLSRDFWLSKELLLSVSLAVLLFVINLYMVWLMNEDSIAITCLLLICFTLSAVWRLADFKDKEGWYLVIIPLSDFATVILALAGVSTIAAQDFKPVFMKPVLETLAGIVTGLYGFILSREILAIEYKRNEKK